MELCSLAGCALAGYAEGHFQLARFCKPCGLAANLTGSILVSDMGNHVVRELQLSGQVVTVAGCGEAGHLDGARHVARFSSPRSVLVDSLGLIYVADPGSHAIRRISTTGDVTTLASGSGLRPQSLVMNAQGDILFTQLMCPQIWKLNRDGVSVFAGQEDGGFADGPVKEARFGRPTSLAMDQTGALVVADALNNCIRKVHPDGYVTTVAGNATAGLKDGLGTAAEFDSPQAVITDHLGNILVADTGNNAVRYIDVHGVVTTYAMLRRSPVANGVFACCHSPTALLLTHEGSLLLTSNNDNRIYILQRAGLNGASPSTAIRTVPPPTAQPRGPPAAGDRDRDRDHGGRKPSYRGGRCVKGGSWKGRGQPYGTPGWSGRTDPQRPTPPAPPPPAPTTDISATTPRDTVYVPLPPQPQPPPPSAVAPSLAVRQSAPPKDSFSGSPSPIEAGSSPDVVRPPAADSSARPPSADRGPRPTPVPEPPPPPPPPSPPSPPFGFSPDASLVVPGLLPPFRHDDKLRIDLGAACGSTLFADAVFLVEEKQIPAHRIVLAARSPYFHELFLRHQDRPLPYAIEVQHASPTAVSLLLRYFYTSELDLDWPSEDDFRGLILLAHRYLMAEVYNRLLIRSRRLMTGSALARWEAFAREHSPPGLRSLVLQCMVQEFPDLRAGDDPALAAVKADPDDMFELMRLALERLTPAPVAGAATAALVVD